MAQPGLDDEIHVVQQIGREALAFDGGGVKIRIALGAFHGGLGRRARQLGAVVAQQDAQGPVVAALDDDFGHGLRDLDPARDGAHMVLALAADHADQIGVGQQGRAAQHRPGHLDLVFSEASDQAGRRIGRGGEPGGQLGADGRLHLVGQGFEHRAVEFSLGGAVLDLAQEVVGQFAQQQPALLAGGLVGESDEVGQAGRLNDFFFGGGGLGHGRSSPSVWGAARTVPSLLRSRAGGASGRARSADDGVWVISTGRASR